MRASIAILALAAVASATVTKRQSIPQCAMVCIASADTGSCDPTDNSCLCKSDAFVNSTYSCIASSCKGDDLTNAVAGARALCAASGVSLTQTVPGSSTAGSTGTATSPAGSASATATATTSSATSAAATPSSSPASNGAAGAAGVSGMVGVFAVAGLLFAL